MCRSEKPKMVEPLFGKARFYVLRYNFSHALEVLNQVVAGHPGFLPALVEKMKVQLALQDWEQAVETAHRCVGEVGVWGVCGGVGCVWRCVEVEREGWGQRGRVVGVWSVWG